MHFNSRFADCVFLAIGRNYSTDFVGRSVIRQISLVHDDFSHGLYYSDRMCPQRSFPVSSNFQLQFI